MPISASSVIASLGSIRPRTAGPNQYADDQLSHHRRQAERAQRYCHQPDTGEQDEQVESDFVHVPP